MILGLSFSHNATACVVDERDGSLLFCCSEERFSRRKNEWGIPRRTLDYIFREVSHPRDISRVVVGESCKLHYGCREYAHLMNLADYAAKDAFIRSKTRVLRLVTQEAVSRSLARGVDLQSLVLSGLRCLGLNAPVTFVDHHAAHAASAFYSGPFEEALVLTLDGEGDGLSGSCWHGRGARLSAVDTLPEEASVGLFYKSITALLGFKVNQQEGKVMGLAAYGNPTAFQAILRDYLAVSCHNGSVRITSEAARFHLNKLCRNRVHFLRLMASIPAVLTATDWEDLLNDLLTREFRRLYQPLFDCNGHSSPKEFAADVAAAAQQVFEEAVLEIVRFYQRKVPSRPVVVAGGVFANVRLNQRILELPGIDALYVHPGMGDEGLALGATYLEAHGRRRTKASGSVLRHVFYGPAPRGHAIRAALSAFPVRWKRSDERTMIEHAATSLANGAVVGLFRGAMEYGPRALGHRSILANPTLECMRPLLNARLRRTDFMPFAPTVLEHCFDTIFSSPKQAAARLPGKFMTITAMVRPEWRDRIPAVVHVDGTARPQILSPEDDPFFHGIVQRFFELTGIGCVLNTSFNLHEEPIVNTPEDALRGAMQGAVDALIIEDFLVEGFPVSSALPRFFPPRVCAR